MKRKRRSSSDDEDYETPTQKAHRKQKKAHRRIDPPPANVAVLPAGRSTTRPAEPLTSSTATHLSPVTEPRQARTHSADPESDLLSTSTVSWLSSASGRRQTRKKESKIAKVLSTGSAPGVSSLSTERPSTSHAASSASAAFTPPSHNTGRRDSPSISVEPNLEHEATCTVISHAAGSESDEDFGGSAIRVSSRYSIPSQERDQPSISATSATSIAERRAARMRTTEQEIASTFSVVGLRPPGGHAIRVSRRYCIPSQERDQPPTSTTAATSIAERREARLRTIEDEIASTSSVGFRPPTAGLRQPTAGLRSPSGSALRETLQQRYQGRRVRPQSPIAPIYKREGRPIQPEVSHGSAQPSTAAAPDPGSAPGAHFSQTPRRSSARTTPAVVRSFSPKASSSNQKDQPTQQDDPYGSEQPTTSAAPAPGFAPGAEFSQILNRPRRRRPSDVTPQGESVELPSDDEAMSISASDNDSDYLPEEDLRIRAPDERERYADLVRRATTYDEQIGILEPRVLTGEDVCHLGGVDRKFDIRCPFCGALHFKTIYKMDKHKRDVPSFIDVRDLICCQGGKVFIPPMQKRPNEIEELTETRRTKEMLLSYNTAFSFASIQYNRVPAAPFGEPVAKSLGLIRHFPSAALPADPNKPRFGNLYLYTGGEAVQLRMQGFGHLDEEVVANLGQAMERCHPFAKVLRTMGHILKEEQRSDGDEDLIRLRIVQSWRVPKTMLQGHAKTYRDPMLCGDQVAFFYKANQDQDVQLPGLMIYPRKNDKVPMPIFPWDSRINTFCYPLLFPYGEEGYKRQPYWPDQSVSYEERLLQWGEENPKLAPIWDLNHSLQEIRKELNRPERIVRLTINDPEMDEAAEEPDGEEDADADDDLLHALQSTVQTGVQQNRRIVERGGQQYPDHGLNDEEEDEDEMEGDDGGMMRGILLANPPILPLGNAYRIDPDGDAEGNDLTPEQDIDDLIATLDLGDFYGDDIPAGQPLRHLPLDSPQGPTSSSTNEQPAQLDSDSDAGSTIDEVPPHRQEELDPSEVHEVVHRKITSLRQYALYIHQQRKVFASDRSCTRNRFTSSGRLGQVFLLDLATRMYQMRSAYQRQHHTEYMTSTRKKFLEAIQNRANRLRKTQRTTIGCVSTVPHTVPGSPRHLQKLYEHTIAMCRQPNSRPDLFITTTCDVNWPEIKNNIPEGDTWANHPMLVNKVFKKRYEKFLQKVVGRPIHKGSAIRRPGHFGQVRWYSYSIEFQQRGPPHAHLVVSLMNHIETPAQIDLACQAELPVLDGTQEKAELRALVEKFMVHRPCEGDNEAYCRQGISPDKKECRKHFPKPFSDTTRFGDTNYPELRRPNNDECSSLLPEADNRHVVAYNAELLSYFRAHVNVEVISNLSVVKYIFKYIFKGYDRVLVEAITSMSAPETAAMTIEGHMIYPKGVVIPPGAKKQRELQARKRLLDNGIQPTDAQGNKVLVYDEYAMVEDQRALTGCEAAWDIQGFPRHGQSHTVVDLFVHGVEQEPISYKKEDQEAMERELQQNADIRTRLKEWFKLNQRDEEARSLSYEELPTKYLFENHQWRKRKQHREQLFGRIKSVHPKNQEVFAIRLLSAVQKGPQSFEELRTVNGVLHPTFVSAAMELGLMNNQIEWDRCLEEASTENSPVMLRRLFAAILVFNFVKDERALWEKYKEHFYDRNPTWSPERKEAHALHHISTFLRAHLETLADHQLPEFAQAHLPPRDALVDDSGIFDVTIGEAERRCEELKLQLNEDQKLLFDRITEAIEDPDHTTPFFLQGSGGTGKTHMMRLLYFYLTWKGHKVACVAHTGVAARLLPNGTTAHRRFHIPLMVEEKMDCKVDERSNEDAVLAQFDVVIWDEATMTDRRILQSVHALMGELHPESSHLLFGGVKFIFGGDWKQTLPIVPGARGASVVNYTMRGSQLWQKTEVLHLTKNMRAQYDPPFAAWLNDVGKGINNIGRHDDNVREEDEMLNLSFGTIVDSEQELMTAILGDLTAPPEVNRRRFESSAVLAVDNKTTFEVNEQALRMMPGEMSTFFSVDEYQKSKEFSFLEPELYHGETPSGMPPHQLNVKVGCPVILMKNINVGLGLVNGTRMIVEKITDHIIWVIPLQPTPRTPKRWPLTRVLFAPISVTRMERNFQRTQFPIRLAFSMTINKAQGQTLDRVGVLLRTPCFSHGQLYVALSRVRKSTDLYIYNDNGSRENRLQKAVEEEAVAETEKQQEKERLEELRKEQAKARKQHKKVPAALPEGPNNRPRDVVFFGPKRQDQRFFTNNVVFASAIE